MKKKWIFWVTVAAAFAALFLLVNFAPSFTCGAAVGWAGKWAYDKWIAKE